MKNIKTWLEENGLMGFTSIALAFVAILLGMWFLFWGSVGFFLGKNWEIIRKLWNEKYKEEVKDLINDLKEKISK